MPSQLDPGRPDSPAQQDDSRSLAEPVSPADPCPRAESRQRALDLLALLSILVVSAGVYLAAGPGAFGTVTGAAATLYAVWRARR
ncbi:hypothetical protein [Streptomyces tateyamensis]|nr:hypothetical protein [Streptomyces tateyamensis]